jgi:WD40 repeat protein
MFVLGNHIGGVNTHGLAYSPDGRLLVSGGTAAWVWDLARRRYLRAIRVLTHVNALAFTPDGRLVIASGRGTTTHLAVFNTQSGRQLRTFPALCGTDCVAVSPDGRVLVAAGHDHYGHSSSRRNCGIRRWNLAAGSGARSLLGHTREVTFVAISPDSRWLLSGAKDRTARLWCLSPRAHLATFRHRVILRDGGFSPDGRTVATAAGHRVGLWDPLTGTIRKWLLGHRATVFGLAVTPDGRLLTGSGDGTVRIWDGQGTEQACFDWGIGPIHSVAVAPDGRTAAAGAARGDIVIWDLDAG